MPIWTKEKPGKLPPKVQVGDPRASLSWQEKTPTDFEIEIKAPANTTLVVNSYYFPGWRAWLNGRPVAIFPGEPYGQIQRALPAGQHQLRIAWDRSAWQMFGNRLSLLGLLVIAGILVKKYCR